MAGQVVNTLLVPGRARPDGRRLQPGGLLTQFTPRRRPVRAAQHRRRGRRAPADGDGGRVPARAARRASSG